MARIMKTMLLDSYFENTFTRRDSRAWTLYGSF